MDDSFGNLTDGKNERDRSVVAWCAAISFLNTGTVRAVFHSVGNLEVLKLTLKRTDKLQDIPLAQRRNR